MSDFLITNIAYGLTGDAAGSRFSGALRVRDGIIAEIGDLVPQPGERRVDASGAVVTPGLVNTHHHLFQSLLKAVPDGINEGLDIWLQKVPYAYWPFIDEEALRVAARVGLAELALSGATTVCDHHYLYAPEYEYDPSAALFEEAAQFGLRFVLARGGNTKGRSYFDDPSLPPAFKEPAQDFLDDVARAAGRWHDPSPLAMTRMAMAPTTPIFNLEPDEVPLFAEAARDLGLRLHSHLSENQTYVRYTLENYGMRPVPWLAAQGWTGPDIWFAHLVELDPGEIAHLAETGTAMAHCTQANARLGSGIAPADGLHRAGGIVSIGVDGAGANEAADMGAAMYSAFTTHRAAKGVQAVQAETVLHWASAGGAKALGYDQIGRIAPGMGADIAIFDISHPRNMGLQDPALAPIITGAATCRDSFVGGKPVVQNGAIAGLDLGDLGREAAEITARLAAQRRSAILQRE
ncbi:MAG: amidohydrolase family protein [Mangrovicoccus sp.]|nr:amidohydrolase family protein [Mangrovicoccus sp.]